MFTIASTTPKIRTARPVAVMLNPRPGSVPASAAVMLAKNPQVATMPPRAVAARAANPRPDAPFTPGFALRGFLLPDFAPPAFALPAFPLPDFALPEFALPSFALPEVALPDFAVPEVELPGLPVPDFPLRAVRLREASPLWVVTGGARSADEVLHEHVRGETGEISDAFALPDELDRNAGLLLHSDHEAALG